VYRSRVPLRVVVVAEVLLVAVSDSSIGKANDSNGPVTMSTRAFAQTSNRWSVET
jgi:hypothetical protein